VEKLATTITTNIGHAAEILAAFIIALALLKIVFLSCRRFLGRHPLAPGVMERLQFGSSVAIALELLLAADVLSTAIAPEWDAIGKLAAIAVLRTALNYFLNKELKEMAGVKEIGSPGTVSKNKRQYILHDETSGTEKVG
jgi:uncharacterized membrane protein